MARKSRGDLSRPIEPGSPEHRQHHDLYREVVESRAEYREECIEQLVDAAILYRAEQQRSDQAHRGRLSQRRRDLLDFVRYLTEALDPGPATMQDIDMQRSLQRFRSPRKTLKER